MRGLLMWTAMHRVQQALGPLLVAAFGPLIASRDDATITELTGATTLQRHLTHLEVRDNHGQRIALGGDPAHARQRVTRVPVALAGQPLGELRYGIDTARMSTGFRRLSQAFNRMAEAVQTQLQALAGGERHLRGGSVAMPRPSSPAGG